MFAKRVQQVMDENGWTMADLSRRVMLSHTSVRKWATGASVASGERLKRLSAATGRPEHWFFMDPDDDDQTVFRGFWMREKRPSFRSSTNYQRLKSCV